MSRERKFLFPSKANRLDECCHFSKNLFKGFQLPPWGVPRLERDMPCQHGTHAASLSDREDTVYTAHLCIRF